MMECLVIERRGHLAMVSKNVDPDNGFVKGRIGGGDNIKVYVLLEVYSS